MTISCITISIMIITTIRICTGLSDFSSNPARGDDVAATLTRIKAGRSSSVKLTVRGA